MNIIFLEKISVIATSQGRLEDGGEDGGQNDNDNIYDIF